MESRSKTGLWLPGLVPVVLIGIGLIHSIVGFSAGSRTLRDMVRDGLWNTVHSEPGPPGRSLMLWFLLTGFLLIVLGHLSLWVERRLRQPLPAFFAIEFLVIALLTLVLSGGGLPAWIFLLAAVYVLVVRFAARPQRIGKGAA